MTMHRPARLRPAFTLVELMVAISIAIVLAGMAIYIVPSINDKRSAARGADQLQGWLLTAKQMARRDASPRGLRIYNDASGNLTQFQYIEVPDPVKVPPNTAIAMNNKPMGAGYYGSVVWIYLDVWDGSQTNVAAGDYFVMQLPNSTTAHRIVTPPTYPASLPYPSAADPTAIPAQPGMTKGTAFQIQLGGEVKDAEAPTGVYTNAAGAFTFYRQPQPSVGESPMSLPQNVIVEPPSSAIPPLSGSLNIKNSAGSYEILFSPSGQLLNATGGRTILWVKHAQGIGEATLITIYSRTGGISAHPEAPAPDPYAFTKDGLDSGL